MSTVQETPIQGVTDLSPEQTVKRLRLVKSDRRHTVCIGSVHDVSEEGFSVAFSYCGDPKEAHEPKCGLEIIPWDRLRPSEVEHRGRGAGGAVSTTKSTTLKWLVLDIGEYRRQEKEQDSRPDPDQSVVELELDVRHANKMQLALGHTLDGNRFISRMRVTEHFCMCLEHRQSEAAMGCFCADAFEKAVSIGPVQQPDQVVRWGSVSDYITFWKTLLEMEAVTVAAEDEFKVVCGVDVTWRDKQAGVFRIPYSMSTAHGLKLRSLVAGSGGECAELSSSWLCIRRHKDSDCEGGWAVHGAVTSVYLESQDGSFQKIEAHGHEAHGQDGELGGCSLEKFKDAGGSMIDEQLAVAFRITSGSRLAEKVTTGCTMDVMPKSAPQTCAALALADFSAGSPLVKQVVLNACASMEVTPRSDDLSEWALNESQEQAARMALEEPLSLIHGPPGTGKTRTAAALAAIFAFQNKEMGHPPAVLYCSPSNDVADHACMRVQALAAEYLQKRSQAARCKAAKGIPASEECAICLDRNCDTVTPCAHVFHQTCLDQATTAGRSTCPLCFLPFEFWGPGLDVIRCYSVEVERADFPVAQRSGVQPARNVRTVSPELRRHALHWRCHGVAPGVTPPPQALRCGRIYNELLRMDAADPRFPEFKRMYMSALCAARVVVLKSADIIFTTCVGSRHAGLVTAARHASARPMAQVIVDEAGQVTEPETLCPLLLPKDIERIVLVGDPKQLLAIIRSSAAKSLGLGVSLLQRLSYTPGANPKMLSLQYRMHPGINAFPSGFFYKGQVATAANVVLRSPSIMAHPRRPGEPEPLLFWDVEATPHKPTWRAATSNSKSYVNSGEAHRVAQLAWNLHRACSQKEPPLSVAVLSWYNAQVDVCSQLLAGADVHVGGVVTAQGSEWDYVILSAVRGGPGSLGVVGDKNLLNVALTRARVGLCVVGSMKKLRSNRPWRSFLSHCLLNDAICEAEPLVLW